MLSAVQNIPKPSDQWPNDEDTYENQQFKKWQFIRLKEVERQLRSLTGYQLTFCRDKAVKNSREILISSDLLRLPFDLISLIAAFKWGLKMAIITEGLLASKQAMIQKASHFAGYFLAKHHCNPSKLIQMGQIEMDSIPCSDLNDISRHIFSFLLGYKKGVKPFRRRFKGCKARLLNPTSICLTRSSKVPQQAFLYDLKRSY